MKRGQMIVNAELHDLAQRYDNPIIRALVQLIPVAGGPMDTLIAGAVEKIRAERTRAFFDELASGAKTLDHETAQSEPFLHAYFATVSAALKTRRREKIAFMARLLASATHDTRELGDEYEELLNILEETSYRELTVVITLADHEDRHPLAIFANGNTENDLQRARRFWPEFQTAIERMGIPLNTQHGYLARLGRTGLIEEFVGSFMDYTGGTHRTTALYYRLAAKIRPPHEGPRRAELILTDIGRFAASQVFTINGVVHNTSSFDVGSFAVSLELLRKDNLLIAEKTVTATLVDDAQGRGNVIPRLSRRHFEAQFFPLPIENFDTFRLRVAGVDWINGKAHEAEVEHR